MGERRYASDLHRARKTATHHRHGFTLIELGVTIAIAALVMGAVAFSISNIRRADLNKTSGIIAASMRYLYNLAVINRTTYRLVIDLDEGKFWGEELASDDPCDRYLPDAQEEGIDLSRAEKRKKKRRGVADEKAEASAKKRISNRAGTRRPSPDLRNTESRE